MCGPNVIDAVEIDTDPVVLADEDGTDILVEFSNGKKLYVHDDGDVVETENDASDGRLRVAPWYTELRRDGDGEPHAIRVLSHDAGDILVVKFPNGLELYVGNDGSKLKSPTSFESLATFEYYTELKPA